MNAVSCLLQLGEHFVDGHLVPHRRIVRYIGLEEVDHYQFRISCRAVLHIGELGRAIIDVVICVRDQHHVHIILLQLGDVVGELACLLFLVKQLMISLRLS